MRILYVPGSCILPVVLPAELITKLPKTIGLFTTAQFLEQLPAIKKSLEDAQKSVFITMPRHTRFKGQIYGCSTLAIDTTTMPVDAFLYIGDGIFHPYALLFHNDQPVYAYNPFDNSIACYTKKQIADILKKHKANLARFYQATTIGVLVTTKPGQNRMSYAEKLPSLFPQKHFYFFLADTIDFAELENFPFIEAYVNTMCPRIGYDDTRRTSKAIVNLEDISPMLF
ncbi:MAG: diphthamide synthesis protein [Candidatus Woesearchaeota archaeon]